MTRVYYDERMAVTKGLGFSKSPGKPKLFVEECLKAGLPFELRDFEPATLDQFTFAHDREFAAGVLQLEGAIPLPNGFGDFSPEIAASLPWTTGSLVAATLDAGRTGDIVFAPVSGMHHAGWAWNGGFCSLNGIVVAAQEVHQHGLAKRVGVLDLDQHDSNGVRDIIEHLGLDFIQLYSFGAQAVMPKNTEAWLADLPEIIRSMNADVMIAQLAADVFEADPLSTSRFTLSQLHRRDRIVFETCACLGVGVAVLLGGGYCDPFENTTAIHVQTMRCANSAVPNEHFKKLS
jgi:acetoin utilization deacetylase AcuC-like enzyme